MELIAAILFAGPLGYLCASRKLGLGLYLLVWALVLPIQTSVVHSESPDDLNASYWVVNAVILLIGLGLNAGGARLRERRARSVTG